MTTSPSMPTELTWFLTDAPSESQRWLAALAVAPVLTDEIAVELITQFVTIPVEKARDFVSALHLSDFVREHNSEWQLEKSIRRYLQTLLAPQEARPLHELLLKRCMESQRDESARVPKYLINGIGTAYHTTELSVPQGLSVYAQLTRHELRGEQWMLGVLAEEQQKRGIIPATAIEPAYLRGITLYREGRRAEAEPLLRSVASSDQRRIEVAIAAHLIGNSLELWRDRPQQAESLLKKSLLIGEELGIQSHQAQVLHSLGQKLWEQEPEQAARFLRKSLRMRRELKDSFGEAQVLHTLGQKLWSDSQFEAEQLLRRSLKLRRELGDRAGETQVLHSLGNKLWNQDASEAEKLLRQSLEIERTSRNRRGEAKVLHSLGQKLWSKNPAESEDLLRQSLALELKLRNRFGEAQVLHSLGQKLWSKNPKEAEKILRESLNILTDLRDQGEAKVLNTLAKLLTESGRTTEADELYERLRALEPRLSEPPPRSRR